MKPDPAKHAAKQRQADRDKLTDFLLDELEHCDQRRTLLFNGAKTHYHPTGTGWQPADGV